MTSDKILYKTPYDDSTFTELYRSSAEVVNGLDSFCQLLYFVEDGHSIP